MLRSPKNLILAAAAVGAAALIWPPGRSESRGAACSEPWAIAKATGRPIPRDCEEKLTQAEAERCSAALRSANVGSLGYTRILMARDGDERPQRLDFDRIVCAAAMDGYRVTLDRPLLFGSPTLAFDSSERPDHQIVITLERTDVGRETVWMATAVDGGRPPLETPLDTLACLQGDARGSVSKIAVSAGLAHLEGWDAGGFYTQGLMGMATCAGWKGAWHRGELLSDTIRKDASRVLKGLIGF